jgi:hypothetical protein
MQVLHHQQMLNFLERHGAPQTLKADMILCYAQQVPVGGIWLASGTIRTNFDKKHPADFVRVGLYLFDEFSRNQRLNFSVKILKGSVFWPVTRSVLDEFLHHA